MDKLVIDATNAILGRLCSYAAKQSLLGRDVVIVNCENMIISGNRRMIIEEYKTTVYRGGHSLKGPFFIKRSPERLVKRTVRGMLSYKQGRGAAALKRIICYNQTPAEYTSSKKVTFEHKLKGNKMTMKELVKEL
ncbi:MAG: 50S ribosomal protein L13 [Nanoarchaeota archaeon]